TFGDLDGARLSANTVATQALAVGGSENLIANPRFVNVGQNDAMLARSDAGWEMREGTYGVGFQHTYARFATGEDAVLRLHDWSIGQIPVSSGERYRFEVVTSHTGGVAAGDDIAMWARMA